MDISFQQFSGKAAEEIRSIRISVFTQEQNVDPELDFDGLDEAASHILVHIDGKAIGTARILDDGHIGRVAVLREFRGTGVGKAIILKLIETARVRGYQRVFLGSQTSAVGFYEKLGFQAFGNRFMDAGIEHQNMELVLMDNK